MAKDENTISVVWSPEDIQSLVPNMSDEEAIEALHTIRDSFKDRATEEGWNILETLLEMYGYKDDEEEEEEE
jgi:hypothetical protein